MLFNSVSFLIFFPIVICVYFILPKKIRQIWLLAASYYFYMSWNVKYALLILYTTAVTYVCGIMIGLFQSQGYDKCAIRYKKLAVGISVALNLAVLLYFKYTNMMLDTISKISGSFGITTIFPAFDIILPVGISFYTFQALGYTIDVYRKEIEPEKNFLKYMLFVSFFPQLVAGPIERTKNLLAQLNPDKKLEIKRLKKSFLMMLWGFFLKLVIADRISIIVNSVYGNYTKQDSYILIVATVLFAFQIYCDFYGYSTIAVGAAHILGIELMENFKAPYLSISVADFWRNWHISLTSWFKDYLYIPLGGSRHGKIRTYINRLCVFLISGLWHGASWSFVAWGGVNGLYQIAGDITKPVRNKIKRLFAINESRAGYKIAASLMTFILIDFTWIFFRAGNINDAIAIICRIADLGNPIKLLDGSLYELGLDAANFWLMIISIIFLLMIDGIHKRGISVSQAILMQDYWFQCVVFVFSIWFILTFGIWGPNFDTNNFIYFQF